MSTSLSMLRTRAPVRAANLLLFILFAGAAGALAGTALSLAGDIAKRAWKRGALAG